MSHFSLSGAALAALVLTGACATPTTTVLRRDTGDGPRVLAVTAHPDDEIAFAGTLYKTATHLGGTCDLLVLTNGEAGYKYSTLAESLYRRRLTDPDVGRGSLPEIRRRELEEGCRILGLRQVGFCMQQDTRYSQDPSEVLGDPENPGAWDLAAVAATLDRWLADGDYDIVLTHLPVPETHGHHKAATILALQAVARMAPEDRPAILGSYPRASELEVDAGSESETPPRPEPPLRLDGFPITERLPGEPVVVFDRRQPFGFRDKLDYRVVVNWAIAAHKSQGTMQLMMNRWDLETFYLYRAGSTDRAPLEAWTRGLGEPQFAPLDYDPSGAKVGGAMLDG